MHFTQEDYKKIEDWLNKRSIKDTEFQEASPLKGDEIIAITQKGYNRKINVKDLVDQLLNLGIEDFINVTSSYDSPNISLEEAIHLIPDKARQEGQVVTFLNKEGKWEIHQFTGKLNQWNNITLWNNLFDWENYVVNSILPDEEDLTKSLPDDEGNTYLSLKDRKYEPDNYSGLGRKVLRKRIVEVEDLVQGTKEKNLLLQEDFDSENTIYEIRYDFDLNGEEITIPEGCILKFKGGSLSNGTIIGNNTIIDAEQYCIFKNNIKILGEWCCPDIYDAWFSMSEIIGEDNSKNLQNMCNLTTDGNSGIIHLSNKKYYVSIKQNGDDESVMKINSDTEIIFDCTICLNTNDFTNYRLLHIKNKNNIHIHGYGKIIGDVDNKIIGTGEWGHGIVIIDSENIIIDGIIIEKCWGDGIYIGQSREDVNLYSNNITIRNATCDYNRRQGMSITAALNLLIENCKFTNTGMIKGTPPAFGVDVEPNLLGVKLNITFRNCVFSGNNKGGLLILNCANDTDIKVENCISDGNFKLANNAKNITFKNCVFPDLEATISPNIADNISFINCHINTNEGLFLKKFYPYSFNGCTFDENTGVSRRVYKLSTTEDNYVCKLFIPESSIADGYYKITAMGGFNIKNINYISEFLIRVRNVGSTKQVGKSFTNIISYNNGGMIDLGDFETNGFLMNAPSFDDNGNLVMYIVNAGNVRYDISLIIEFYSFAGGNGLTGCQCSAVSPNEMPNQDYTFIPTSQVRGSTTRISRYIALQTGVCVFNTSVNKMIWWNGSSWVDANGSSV